MTLEIASLFIIPFKQLSASIAPAGLHTSPTHIARRRNHHQPHCLHTKKRAGFCAIRSMSCLRTSTQAIAITFTWLAKIRAYPSVQTRDRGRRSSTGSTGSDAAVIGHFARNTFSRIFAPPGRAATSQAPRDRAKTSRARARAARTQKPAATPNETRRILIS